MISVSYLFGSAVHRFVADNYAIFLQMCGKSFTRKAHLHGTVY